jgi:hypothetical protein
MDFRSKEAVALAYKMKREMVSGLQAQIKLQQQMLLATQKELTELQWLDGEKLVRVMSGLDPNEVLKHQQDWIQELRELITGGWDEVLEDAA